MSWKTIYIVGNNGFCDEVMKQLDRSDIQFMSGYSGRNSADTHELFWIPENMDLRVFKEAIGAKAVFKYRLRFYLTLEEFIERMNNEELTAEDKRKIEAMRMTDRAA